MNKKKLLIPAAALTLTLSACSSGAVSQTPAKTSVSISDNKISETETTGFTPEAKSFGTDTTALTSEKKSSETTPAAGETPSEKSPAEDRLETGQTPEKTAETTSASGSGSSSPILIEIQDAEVAESAVPPSADAGNGLPSTELCVGTAKEIFDQTNAERAAQGLPPLVWSDELARAADIRAEEIITDFSHTRPNGEKCYSLGSNIHGENIARGPHATGEEFVERWMNSPGHKANILRTEVYTAIGVGVRCTENGDTAVQLFGTY